MTGYNFAAKIKATLFCPSGHNVAEYSPTTLSDLECLFVIDSKRVDQVYFWPETGLRLYLPAGPLPQHVDKKFIKLRTNTKGSFHFPADVEIVSALYTIETDVDLEVKLEIEHCYRGDLAALAFTYCKNRESPFDFTVTYRDAYDYLFTSTHGVITTEHFSHWGICKRLKRLPGYQWLKRFLGYQSHPEDIVVFPFYKITRKSSTIRVHLVVLKDLKAHIEV